MEHDIFLTFDMDWANDDVLRYFHEMICQMDLYGTLHVTHDTPVLDEIRKENRLELGIHPDFTRLLQNRQEKTTDLQTIIHNLLEIVPEAVSVRSHALVRGSLISKYLAQAGLKIESNIYYLPVEGIRLKSYRDIWGMIQLPFIFEDDLYVTSDMGYRMDYFLGEAFLAPRVFNFHPVHLFLNTDEMGRYEKAKTFTGSYKKLKEYVNDGTGGIRDAFAQLVHMAKRNGWKFWKLNEICAETGLF